MCHPGNPTEKRGRQQHIQQYRAPAVNDDAEDYIHLVDIRVLVNNGEMTEPPYATNMDEATLQNFTQQALRTGIPAHTQSTE